MAIFVGKGDDRDVNVTGVVGGNGPVIDYSPDGDDKDRSGSTHTGVTHLGTGSVTINGTRQ